MCAVSSYFKVVCDLCSAVADCGEWDRLIAFQGRSNYNQSCRRFLPCPVCAVGFLPVAVSSDRTKVRHARAFVVEATSCKRLLTGYPENFCGIRYGFPDPKGMNQAGQPLARRARRRWRPGEKGRCFRVKDDALQLIH